MNSIRNPATAAELDRLAITVPTEQYDVTPGRGLYHCERVDAATTASGLHIPDAARQKTMGRWRVLGVGPAQLVDTGAEVPPLYAVGDELWVAPQLGNLLELPGNSGQILVTESCVVARVKVRTQ